MKQPKGFKMLLIVRTDLKMSKGKVAAQCSHATLGLYKKMLETRKIKEDLETWELTGQKKVVLKCKNAKTLSKIMDTLERDKLLSYLVVDAGLTEVPPGSQTVLAVFGSESTLSKHTGHLSTY